MYRYKKNKTLTPLSSPPIQRPTPKPHDYINNSNPLSTPEDSDLLQNPMIVPLSLTPSLPLYMIVPISLIPPPLHYSDLLQNPMIVPVKVLKGHKVNSEGVGVIDAVFHPTQPWIFSAGADATIRLFT